MKTIKSEDGAWSINSKLDLYVLKLENQEGTETIWLEKEELENLRNFLNSLKLEE